MDKEYLPEVGQECEWKGLRGGFWVKSELIAINDKQAVLLHKDESYKEGEYEILPLHCVEFRPIQTEVNKERESQIMALHDITKQHKWHEGLTDEEAGDLVDSGVRVLGENQFIGTKLSYEQIMRLLEDESHHTPSLIEAVQREIAGENNA